MESADTHCIPCNPAPPYGCDWPTNGTVLGEADLERYGLSATNMLLSIAEAQAKLLANLPFTCTVTQTVASATGTNVSRKVTFDIGFCGAGGGVKGAEHWNNPGHAPSYAPVSKASVFCCWKKYGEILFPACVPPGDGIYLSLCLKAGLSNDPAKMIVHHCVLSRTRYN